MTFKDWLKTAQKKDGNPLSERSVNHYADGLKTISREMIENNIIDKKLEDMELHELDVAIAIILVNPSFLAKDKRGNKMYSNALKRYRCYKYLNTDLGIQEVIEESLVKNDIHLTSTEKEVIVKARRGQGLYRDLLMEKYNGKCIITNITITQALIASHIKPWAVCDNQERIDVNNGLLLSATYDRLFDSGLITLDENGRIKISKLISKKNADILNLVNGTKYDIKYCHEMLKYIKYHNEYIFVN